MQSEREAAEDEELREMSDDYWPGAFSDSCSEASEGSQASSWMGSGCEGEEEESSGTDDGDGGPGNVPSALAAARCRGASGAGPGLISERSCAPAGAAVGEAPVEGEGASRGGTRGGFHVAVVGGRAADLQRIQPLSSYATTATRQLPGQVSTTGQAEAVGQAEAFLKAAQSPTLREKKIILNVDRNGRRGMLKSMDAGSGMALVSYTGGRYMENAVRSEILRVCPLGGETTLQRRLRLGEQLPRQAVVIIGGQRAGCVGLTGSTVSEQNVKVYLVDAQTGDTCSKPVSVDFNLLHAFSESELAGRCVSEQQRHALAGHANSTAERSSPMDDLAALGASAMVATGLAPVARGPGGAVHVAPASGTDDTLESYTVPRVQFAAFLLVKQMVQFVDYNFRRIKRWGPAQAAFRRMTSDHEYPPTKGRRTQRLDSLELECRCAARHGCRRKQLRDGPSTKADRAVGCPHKMLVFVPASQSDVVVVLERARHRSHTPSPRDPRLRLVPEVVDAIEEAAIRHGHPASQVLQQLRDMLPQLAAPYIQAGCITAEEAQTSRRFNPTAGDVDNIRKRHARAWSGGKDDVGATEHLLATAHARGLITAVLHYQITESDVQRAQANAVATRSVVAESVLVPALVVDAAAVVVPRGAATTAAGAPSGSNRVGAGGGSDISQLMVVICREATRVAQAQMCADPLSPSRDNQEELWAKGQGASGGDWSGLQEPPLPLAQLLPAAPPPALGQQLPATLLQLDRQAGMQGPAALPGAPTARDRGSGLPLPLVQPLPAAPPPALGQQLPAMLLQLDRQAGGLPMPLAPGQEQAQQRVQQRPLLCDIPGMPNGPPLRPSAAPVGDAADAGRAAGEGCSSATGGPHVHQRYRLTLTTPWMERMLRLHGGKVVLMDASYGLDVYNYPLIVLMVVDHHGCGIPVAFGIISAHESKDEVMGFLQDVEEATGVKMERFLIDKGSGAIAALEELQRAIFWCIFRMKKAVEDKMRNLRILKEERDRISLWLDRLIYASDKDAFGKEEKTFLERLEQTQPEFVQYYKKNWQPYTERWAIYARPFNITTTNHIERFFRLLKYTLLKRRAFMPLATLLRHLLTRAVPYFIRQVALRELGFAASRQDGAPWRHQRAVERMAKDSDRTMAIVDAGLGVIVVRSARRDDSSHLVCLTDGTCTCRDAAAGLVCLHVEAAAKVSGGGVDDARRRAIEGGVCLAFGSGGVMLAERSDTEAVYRSLTTWPSTCAAALELMGSARRRPLYGSRQKAVVSIDGPTPHCSCNIFGCHGLCAHVVAELLFRDGGNGIGGGAEGGIHSDSSGFTVEDASRVAAGFPGVAFEQPLARVYPDPANRPDAATTADALAVGRTEASGLRALLASSTGTAAPHRYPGAAAMRAGAAVLLMPAVRKSRHTAGLVDKFFHLLTPRRAAVVEAGLQQAESVLQPLAAAAAGVQVGGEAGVMTPAVRCSPRSCLLAPPQERPPSSTDHRALGDTTTKTLHSKEWRAGSKRSRGGSDSEASDSEPTGQLLKAGKTSKQRKKPGLRQPDRP